MKDQIDSEKLIKKILKKSLEKKNSGRISEPGQRRNGSKTCGGWPQRMLNGGSRPFQDIA